MAGQLRSAKLYKFCQKLGARRTSDTLHCDTPVSCSPMPWTWVLMCENPANAIPAQTIGKMNPFAKHIIYIYMAYIYIYTYIFYIQYTVLLLYDHV